MLNSRTSRLAGFLVIAVVLSGATSTHRYAQTQAPAAEADTCEARYEQLLQGAKSALIKADRKRALALLLDARSVAQRCPGIRDGAVSAPVLALNEPSL